jgi:hypothetical protein
LNALNPNACPENQRIYEFESVDRDRREVRLTRKNGRPIADNLSMFDLFSFDVDDGGVGLISNGRFLLTKPALETSPLVYCRRTRHAAAPSAKKSSTCSSRNWSTSFATPIQRRRG